MARNKKEQEMYDNLGDLFAIIKTTEKLERAYVRDDIKDVDYEPACQKLIGQFRTLWNSIKEQVPDVQQFMAEHHMQCPMAMTRLIRSGIPATIEHGSASSANDSSLQLAVAQSVSAFITAMDSLKLGMVAIDEISPLLQDLLQNLNRLVSLPPDFAAKEKVRKWVSDVHSKPASYELPEDDVRQLLFDLESSYNELLASLHKTK